MQQMLLCISYCILNHSDNQESIHLFARERSMNTHTHRYFLRQKRTIKQHSNIWNELWPLLKTTHKKKAPPKTTTNNSLGSHLAGLTEIDKCAAIKHRSRPAIRKLLGKFSVDGPLIYTSFMIYNGLTDRSRNRG